MYRFRQLWSQTSGCWRIRFAVAIECSFLRLASWRTHTHIYISYNIPVPLYLTIVQLHRFHLSCLVRVSRAINHAFIPDLYEHVVVKTPSTQGGWTLERVLDLTPRDLLRYTQRVTFSISLIQVPEAASSEERMNLLISLLLRYLPNLVSFQFRHRLRSFDKRTSSDPHIRLTSKTILKLLETAPSLRDLTIRSKFPACNIPTSLVPQLRSLDYEISVNNTICLSQLLCASSKTLRSLRLTSNLSTLAVIIRSTARVLSRVTP